MTGWHQARRYAREAGSPLPAAEVPLAAAAGSALAKPLVALTALPGYDAAAMDGYAIAGAGPWRVVGRILAGDPGPPGPLPPGTTVEIGTGAMVPAGAEAVLPYEKATLTDGTVTGDLAPGRLPGSGYHGRLPADGSHAWLPADGSHGRLPGDGSHGRHIRQRDEPRHGRHIRRRGEDCAAGQEVLPAGTVVSPAVLGLAASLGHDTLAVHRRPRAAIVVTGAELRRSGIPAAGQVRDAIGPMLPGLLRAAGADPAGEARVTDEPGALADAMRRSDADVVVVCGATSAGAADHLRGALDTLGARVPIRGVACRPGHPQLFAVLPDGRFVVGLPGNPYAALVAALTLLSPLLGSLAGRAEPPTLTATPAGPVAPHDRDTRLVAVTRIGSLAQPVGHDRPGSLWGAAGADALAVVPPGWTGGEVELLPLPTP